MILEPGFEFDNSADSGLCELLRAIPESNGALLATR